MDWPRVKPSCELTLHATSCSCIADLQTIGSGCVFVSVCVCVSMSVSVSVCVCLCLCLRCVSVVCGYLCALCVLCAGVSVSVWVY